MLEVGHHHVPQGNDVMQVVVLDISRKRARLLDGRIAVDLAVASSVAWEAVPANLAGPELVLIFGAAVVATLVNDEVDLSIGTGGVGRALCVDAIDIAVA